METSAGQPSFLNYHAAVLTQVTGATGLSVHRLTPHARTHHRTDDLQRMARLSKKVGS